MRPDTMARFDQGRDELGVTEIRYTTHLGNLMRKKMIEGTPFLDNPI